MVFFIFIILPGLAFAQKGFYRTDSTVYENVKIADRGAPDNYQYFIVIEGNSFEKYTPDEVPEYAINKEKVFFSKSVKINGEEKKVFLKLLYSDSTKLSLYEYEEKNLRTYFIEKGNSLIEISKRHPNMDSAYKQQLSELTSDCETMQEAIPWIKYNPVSLSASLTRYSKCTKAPFPHLKFGLIAGTEFSKLTSSTSNFESVMDDFEYDFRSNYLVGVFIDQPIRTSNYSIHSEIFYSQHSYYSFKNDDGHYIDFSTEKSTIKIPILLRYTMPSVRFRPFVNAGFTLGYNFNTKRSMIVTTQVESESEEDDSRILEISRYVPSTNFPEIQTSFSAGAGAEIKISRQNFLFFEVRASKGLGDPQKIISSSEIQLLTGISF